MFIHPAIPTIAEQIPVDIPVFAMEFTFDTTRAVFNLAYTGALERYPNIRFICAHAGGTVPYLVARFDLLWFQDPALVERAPHGGSAYLARLFYDTALSANSHALRSLTDPMTIPTADRLAPWPPFVRCEALHASHPDGTWMAHPTTFRLVRPGPPVREGAAQSCDAVRVSPGVSA